MSIAEFGWPMADCAPQAIDHELWAIGTPKEALSLRPAIFIAKSLRASSVSAFHEPPCGRVRSEESRSEPWPAFHAPAHSLFLIGLNDLNRQWGTGAVLNRAV